MNALTRSNNLGAVFRKTKRGCLVGYIICAEVDTDSDINHPKGIDRILEIEGIRLLSKRDGHYTLDMRGEFDRNAEQVLYLCKALVDNGILEFDIRHSY
jgi:hypothetical protein